MLSITYFIYSNSFYYLKGLCEMLWLVCRQCVVDSGMRSFLKNTYSQHYYAIIFSALSLLSHWEGSFVF